MKSRSCDDCYTNRGIEKYKEQGYCTDCIAQFDAEKEAKLLEGKKLVNCYICEKNGAKHKDEKGEKHYGGDYYCPQCIQKEDVAIVDLSDCYNKKGGEDTKANSNVSDSSAQSGRSKNDIKIGPSKKTKNE